MYLVKLYPLLLVAAIAGCMGASGVKETKEPSVRSEDSGAFIQNGARKDAWKNADRCTMCHVVWSWEYGYYRGWDRHGLISDYSKRSPIGYKDPWGLDVPVNTFKEYYYTGWWKGPWLEEKGNLNPEMFLDGYGPVNEGKSKPEDFKGQVIVVDQAGNGDFRTIQDGVNRVSRGGMVFVRPGTYKESIRLREGVRLWGADPKTTIINSGTKQHGIVAANDCDISGFTITGTGMDYEKYIFTAGVHALDCDASLTIRGNIFYSNAVFGVLVESSRAGGTPKNPADRYLLPEKALQLLEYTGYSSPRIIGNTFYMIGERAVYCIHASPEIANNVFMGNVKTVGMTQLSRPFIHHNVFYRNNVPLNINRSMPVVAYNIMLRNHWGQRVIEGSLPVIHNNITWESPWYKEFAEDGRPIPYTPFPGTGEQEVNPALTDPDKGDFRLSLKSPVKRLSNTKSGYGLIRGYGIQYPPTVPCKESWGEGFLCKNDTTRTVVSEIDRQNSRIKTLELTYSIEYRSFMEVKFDPSGNQLSATIRENPVSGTDYAARYFSSLGNRQKTYKMRLFAGSKSLVDSGTVFFDGERIRVPEGYFKTDSRVIGDARQVGERPVRENLGGLYLDYDQYLNGAIGPGGTFYFGCLRILGGLVYPKKESVDGHECIVLQYPHLGADQFYRFYLDPQLGYRPRKLEHYFERKLYRKIDGYRYQTVGGVPLPVAATITDYAVKEPHAGKTVGTCVMKVKAGSIKVNGSGGEK
ncbi:MAG: right-handed parallel beta-helix repeat-containing protein [Candidatus Latescibacterota bacterium]